MDNLYLAHHGVKGQKWGVRRTPAQLGHDVPTEGGGGGGGVELDPEELKKLKERLEAMASDNFSDEEIMKLVNGKPVEKTLVDDKGKKTYMFKETFMRDGNSLKYQRQQFEMTAPNTYRHINKDINTTLDDIDGNKPFSGVSVNQSKAQRDAMMARTAAERGRQKLHQMEVDRKLAAAQKERQQQHQRDVDKRIANAPITEKQQKHREDVDRRIAEAKRQKQRQHQYDVDKKIKDTQTAQAQKRQQHREDVDRRVAEGKRQKQRQEQHRSDVDRRIRETQTQQASRQSQHKADVDRRIREKREWDRNVEDAKRTVERTIDDAKRGADETLYRIRRRIEGL